MVLAPRTKQDKAFFASLEPYPLLLNLRRTHILPWDLTQRWVRMEPITPNQLPAHPTELTQPPVWIKVKTGSERTQRNHSQCPFF